MPVPVQIRPLELLGAGWTHRLRTGAASRSVLVTGLYCAWLVFRMMWNKVWIQTLVPLGCWSKHLQITRSSLVNLNGSYLTSGWSWTCTVWINHIKLREQIIKIMLHKDNKVCVLDQYKIFWASFTKQGKLAWF